jgi:glycosyltransferase involved in cell wall biosynthesis
MRVTAIVPCYNAEPFLAQALESIFAQTRAADEVIVVDDSSTDSSREIVARYPVRLLNTTKNSGHAVARNLAIEAASCDVIAWLDADDYWEPAHLEIVVGLLHQYPDVAVAFSGVRCVGARSDVWTGFPCSSGPRRILRESFQATVIPAMSVVTRKKQLDSAGRFDVKIRFAPDFDLWLRMARRYHFVSTDEVTANYRWHAGQISAKPEQQMTSMWTTRERFLETLAKEGDLESLREIEDTATSLWEARMWMLWYQARMSELRAHVKMARFFEKEPHLARAFRLRRMLPSKLVSTWHCFAQASDRAAQT